jgi:hypothetical protein
VAAGEAQQALRHGVARIGAAGLGGVDGAEARGGAVLVADALPFAGDDVGRLVPRDALEPAFAALADPLHRVFEPVRIVDEAPITAPAHAGAHDRHILDEFVVAPGADPRQHAVLDVRLDGALAAAVEGRGGAHHAFGCIDGLACGLGGRRDEPVGEERQRRQPAAELDETPACDNCHCPASIEVGAARSVSNRGADLRWIKSWQIC